MVQGDQDHGLDGSLPLRSAIKAPKRFRSDVSSEASQEEQDLMLGSWSLESDLDFASIPAEDLKDLPPEVAIA
jgi:hypothetical protein